MSNRKILLIIVGCLVLAGLTGATVIDSKYINLKEDGELQLGGDNIIIDAENSKLNIGGNNPILTMGESKTAVFNDLSIQNHDILNPGLVNQVNLTNHSIRHENGGVDDLNVSGLSGVLANPQRVQSHGNSKHSQAYTTLNTDVESFSTTSTEGEIPVSNNGKLEMKSQSELGLSENIKHVDSAYTTAGESTILVDAVELGGEYDLVRNSERIKEYTSRAKSFDLEFNDDGTQYYQVDSYPNDNTNITQYSLSNAYEPEIEDLTRDLSVNLSSQVTSITGIQWRSSGDKLFVLDTSNPSINEYSSTDYEISTLNYNTELDISQRFSYVRGFYIDSSGNDMYIAGGDNNGDPSIAKYTLSTPDDIATASYVSKINITPEIGTDSGDFPTDVRISDDGEKMVVTAIEDSFVGKFYQYNLTSPYDITSAVFDGEKVTLNDPEAIWFRPDNKEFYLTSPSGVEKQFAYDSHKLSSDDTDLEGNTVRFKDSTGSAGTIESIYITGEGDTSINGQNVVSISEDFGSITLKSDGDNWYGIGGYKR